VPARMKEMFLLESLLVIGLEAYYHGEFLNPDYPLPCLCVFPFWEWEGELSLTRLSDSPI
jgi:hypothetical protein